MFTPTARTPQAGLLLALPALQATGLAEAMSQVYGELKPGFYRPSTIILDIVFRTLAGEPRAEGATRRDPVAFGRLLDMDRAPDAYTIRRKHKELAQAKKAGNSWRPWAGTTCKPSLPRRGRTTSGCCSKWTGTCALTRAQRRSASSIRPG